MEKDISTQEDLVYLLRESGDMYFGIDTAVDTTKPDMPIISKDHERYSIRIKCFMASRIIGMVDLILLKGSNLLWKEQRDWQIFLK